MFSNAMNVVLGRKEDKQMITGIYTIAKIYCSNCGQELGWHYLRAYDLKQKWKEGNFILEKFKMLKEYKQPPILLQQNNAIKASFQVLSKYVCVYVCAHLGLGRKFVYSMHFFHLMYTYNKSLLKESVYMKGNQNFLAS